MNTSASPLSLLADAGLLKTDALIDGRWHGGARRFAVTDPATGTTLAQVANLGADEAARRDRRGQPGLAGLARQAGEGAQLRS